MKTFFFFFNFQWCFHSNNDHSGSYSRSNIITIKKGHFFLEEFQKDFGKL